MFFYRADNPLSYHYKKHKTCLSIRKSKKTIRAFAYHVNEKIFYINTIKDINYPSQERVIFYTILF